MASEAEKERILSDYFAAGEDDEDEADFDPSDHGEESDPFEDDGESDDDEDDESEEEGAENDNYAVLNGQLHLNEEGDRLVYSGTWSMKKDLDASEAGKDEEKKEEDAEEGGDGSDESGGDGGGKTHHHLHKKKKTKFKLKSKQIAPPSPENGVKHLAFDLSNPTVSHRARRDPQAVPPKRTMLFDGFFFTSEDEGHRKIKERDVEITFFAEEPEGLSPRSDSSSHASSDDGGAGDETKRPPATTRRFKVLGRGTNEFGEFGIEGSYAVRVPSADPTSDPVRSIALTTFKKYRPASPPAASSSASGRKRRAYSEEYGDEDEDDDMSDDAGADYNELIALNEEANMSVEELRKRYYGGGMAKDDDDGGGGGGALRKPPAKKLKEGATDESDDDGCGF